MLRGFTNDNVALVKVSGQRIDGIKASVQPKLIFVSNATLPIEEGDRFERRLPNGLIESYTVLDRGTPNFSRRYRDFMALAADHIAVLVPILPALANLL